MPGNGVIIKIDLFHGSIKFRRNALVDIGHIDLPEGVRILGDLLLLQHNVIHVRRHAVLILCVELDVQNVLVDIIEAAVDFGNVAQRILCMPEAVSGFRKCIDDDGKVQDRQHDKQNGKRPVYPGIIAFHDLILFLCFLLFVFHCNILRS